ncbi:MAG: sodium/glutamate symporter [Pasteurellaceae bacterium]|nr:sodium/glutamate symporter [Pasteurellaceae bacterium]
MTFDTYETIALACLVLLLGDFLVKRIKFLSDFNIPEPVVGGFLVAILLTIIYHYYGISFTFDTNVQRTMMLAFFTSIGLSANFARLVKGGKPLVIFLIVAAILIVVQDIVGMFGAKALGIHPAYGLLAGSVTLTGGHGTGATWAEIFKNTFHIPGTLEIAMACATFGLVSGGILGGPVARFLLKRMNRQTIKEDDTVDDVEETFEKPRHLRKINTRTIIETITMMSIALVVGQYLDSTLNPIMDKYLHLPLPTFLWCLFTGVIIRNLLTHTVQYKVSEEAIDVLGSVALSIFLAIALMVLKMWQIADLALPVLVILIVQAVIMVFFAIYVTYRAMGKDYDAVVLSAGHCGFGLGATSTAVANMQAITSNYGPSHKAFLIVPMVGAFFIDLLNAGILSVFNQLIPYIQ